uniref:Uncharacterized protein n=1 Tax=Plectus sambesii TaxID=2011161 RepID=A0A914X3X1_9BILA
MDGFVTVNCTSAVGDYDTVRCETVTWLLASTVALCAYALTHRARALIPPYFLFHVIYRGEFHTSLGYPPPTAYGVAGAAQHLVPSGGGSISRRRSPPLGPPPLRTCWDSLPPAVHWSSSSAAAACFVLLLLQATLPVPHVSSRPTGQRPGGLCVLHDRFTQVYF